MIFKKTTHDQRGRLPPWILQVSTTLRVLWARPQPGERSSQLGEKNSFRSVIDLVEAQAEALPKSPALGFADFRRNICEDREFCPGHPRLDTGLRDYRFDDHFSAAQRARMLRHRP
jgi:hypothetical protein